MDKLDFVKQDKHLYDSDTTPELIMVPGMLYLMYDGKGMPKDNPEFQRAFNALFGVAYSLKFLAKKGHVPRGYKDFKVAPPEGLWWMEGDESFDLNQPDKWRWTLMIRMPEFVTQRMVLNAIEELVEKKKDHSYRNVRLSRLNEGPSVQVLHVGPYETEQDSIAKLHDLVHALGYRLDGKHHEIYFGDPRRTKPERLKTILRHPVTAMR